MVKDYFHNIKLIKRAYRNANQWLFTLINAIRYYNLKSNFPMIKNVRNAHLCNAEECNNGTKLISFRFQKYLTNWKKQFQEHNLVVNLSTFTNAI